MRRRVVLKLVAALPLTLPIRGIDKDRPYHFLQSDEVTINGYEFCMFDLVIDNAKWFSQLQFTEWQHEHTVPGEIISSFRLLDRVCLQDEYVGYGGILFGRLWIRCKKPAYFAHRKFTRHLIKSAKI